MKIILLTIAGLFCLTMNTEAKWHFQSGAQQVGLLELYTSEGCSSCPPAEAWLSRLKDDPNLWKTFVPLAYHVDYWNRLGWTDRYSSSQWSERQSRYAALWSNDSVYTPGFVLNGKEWRNWSSKLPSPTEKTSGQLQASSDDGQHWTIGFRPENGTGNNWETHLAVLGAGVSSKIGAGENSGRNLVHDFVVLSQSDQPMKNENGEASASLTTPNPALSSPRVAIAIWVTRRGELAPVQATGGWIK